MLDFLIFAAVVVVCLIVAIIYLYPGSRRSTTVPGPEPVDSLEGNVPDIVACGSLYEFLYKTHEQYGPIVSFWLGPTLCISLGSAQLFSEQANVFDRPSVLYEALDSVITSDAVVVTNGAEGRRRHAAYAKCFMPSSTQNHCAICNQEAQRVIDRWSQYPAGEFIPLMKHMFEYSIRTVLLSLYGLGTDDEQLINTIHASYDVCIGEIERQLRYEPNELATDANKRFLQHKDNLHHMIQQLTRSRRGGTVSSQRNCAVVGAAVSLGVSDSVVSADLISILINALTTIAPLLTWMTYCLAVNDDIQDAARQEVNQLCAGTREISSSDVDGMTYLRQVLNETLRWAVISPVTGRVQDIDTVLGGHTIPAGTPVIHALGIALHDPEVFPEPDKFDPERFSADRMQQMPLYAFEPFGFAGKRSCLGRRFAITAVSVLMARLLRSGLQLCLAPDQTVSPVYGISSRPEDEIWISTVTSEELT